MLRSTGLRVVLLLVLLAAVATPVIAAGPGDRLPRPAGDVPGFVGTLWHALTSLFASGTSRAKSGSIMDPDGLTATGGTCQGENGSIMDPNGCPTAGTDLGSVMDPDG